MSGFFVVISCADLIEAVGAAADKLGYEVEFLDDEGICLAMRGYDLKENAALLLTLKRELFYTATVKWQTGVRRELERCHSGANEGKGGQRRRAILPAK